MKKFGLLMMVSWCLLGTAERNAHAEEPATQIAEDARLRAESEAKAQEEVRLRAESDARAQDEVKQRAESDARAADEAMRRAESDAKAAEEAQKRAESDAKAQADYAAARAGEGVNVPAGANTASAPATFPTQMVSVISPAYRANIKGDTQIVFRAPGMATAEATCWRQGPGFGADSNVTAQPVALDAEGAGSFLFPADTYPQGPIVIRIIAKSADGKKTDNCYLQLYNEGGVRWNAGLKDAPTPPQAAGMTVTYADDFEEMPTISRTGQSATYCSVKPDGTEYSDAIFADREGPYNPFSQVDTYLRIRTTHRPDLPEVADRFGWKRKYTTGFLASLRQDGTGFRTAGGREQYFECRMAYDASPGIWPAFWLLSANNYKGNPGPCDELDILENYMPWPNTYHIARHEWGHGKAHEECKPAPDVTKIGGGANTVQTFHTYGCLIQEQTTTYYFDNVKVWSHPTHKYSWQEGNYFMVNNAIKTNDATRNGTFRRYGGEADLWVDWVRVYEKK